MSNSPRRLSSVVRKTHPPGEYLHIFRFTIIRWVGFIHIQHEKQYKAKKYRIGKYGKTRMMKN